MPTRAFLCTTVSCVDATRATMVRAYVDPSRGEMGPRFRGDDKTRDAGRFLPLQRGVGGAGDLEQLLVLQLADHGVGQLLVDPVEGGVAVDLAIAEGGGALAGLGHAMDGDAEAVAVLVHEERGRAAVFREEPSADQADAARAASG